jgi:hypothetical protein
MFAAAVAAGACAVTPAGAQADPTLTLTLGPQPSLGAFVPGIAGDYATTTTASVSSPGASATLTVADLSGAGVPGHLMNGAAGPSLAEALAVGAASSAPGATSAPPAPIGDAPTTILTYSQPALDDSVTITLHQHIDATEPLRSGRYAKTLTFTLSTTSP